MSYTAVCQSLDEFVYRVAVYGVAKGYLLYASGSIPASKQPEAIDRKLIEKYKTYLNKNQRAYQKRLGRANVLYLRCDAHYLLLATPGTHPVFFNGHTDFQGNLLPEHAHGEQKNLRDARTTPILIGDYSIASVDGHAVVEIRREVYRVLRTSCLEMATKRRRTAELETLLHDTFPHLPFRPIQRQIQALIVDINRQRQRKKLPRIAMPSWTKNSPAPHLHKRAA